jgi:hypothetical protein
MTRDPLKKEAVCDKQGFTEELRLFVTTRDPLKKQTFCDKGLLKEGTVYDDKGSN